MRALHWLCAAALLAGCSGGKTLVHLTVDRGSAPAGITTVVLDLAIGANTDHVTLTDNGNEIQLPTSVNLEIRHGSGALTIDAHALDVSGTEVASASTSTTVVSGKTVDVALALEGGAGADMAGSDAGTDDLSGFDMGAPQLTIDRSPMYDYGQVLTSSSTPASFVISNPGTARTGALAVTITGADSAAFAADTACTGMQLAPGGNCTLTVTFHPLSPGSKSAVLQVTAGTLLATVSLSGNVVDPGNLTVMPSTPPPIDFGMVVLGGMSSEVVFTIKNTGGAATGVPVAMLTATDATYYTITTNTCNAALAANGTCTVGVRFTPPGSGTGGTKSAQLAVSATPGGNIVAALTGLALTPATLSLTTPGGTSFGTVDVGSNNTLTINVANSGTQPSGTPTIMLSDTTNFSVVNNMCTGAVVTGTPCSFGVKMAPAAFGMKSVTVTVSATPGGSAMTTLTGTGRDQVTLKVVRAGDSSTNTTADGTVSEASSGLSCGTTCTVTVFRTTASPMLTLTAAPNATTSQATVGSWTGCDSSTGNSCTVTVTGTSGAPTTVTATFALKLFTWTLTNSALGGASGTFDYTGGTCTTAGGSACSPAFKYGAGITLTATGGANSNATTSTGTKLPWSFAGWTGGPCAGTSTSPCNVASVTATATVTATFTPYNFMFVTSDFSTAPGAFGGFDPMGMNDGFRGADAHCQQLADASSLAAVKGKTYRAWVAKGTTTTVDAYLRLFNSTINKQPRGWVRTDGRPFSDTIRFGSSSQTFAFPMVDENGTTITTNFNAATTANGTGTPEGGDGACGAWTSTAGSTIGGDPGNGDHLFSRYSGASCGPSSSRIYCFGIDYAAPIVMPAPSGSLRHIFASTTAYTPTDGGSIADPDNVCKQDAVTAGLCTAVNMCSYIAVVTPNGNTAASRFSNPTFPVYRLDNVRVASSTTNFFAGTIDAAAGRRPDGNFAGGFFHWTGGTGTGTAATTCSGWTTKTTGTGTMAQINDIQMRTGTSTRFFTSLGSPACTSGGYLMCMEQ